MIDLTRIKKSHVLAFLYLLYSLDKPLPRRNSRPHGSLSRSLLDGLGGRVSGVLCGQALPGSKDPVGLTGGVLGGATAVVAAGPTATVPRSDLAGFQHSPLSASLAGFPAGPLADPPLGSGEPRPQAPAEAPLQVPSHPPPRPPPLISLTSRTISKLSSLKFRPQL